MKMNNLTCYALTDDQVGEVVRSRRIEGSVLAAIESSSANVVFCSDQLGRLQEQDTPGQAIRAMLREGNNETVRLPVNSVVRLLSQTNVQADDDSGAAFVLTRRLQNAALVNRQERYARRHCDVSVYWRRRHGSNDLCSDHLWLE